MTVCTAANGGKLSPALISGNLIRVYLCLWCVRGASLRRAESSCAAVVGDWTCVSSLAVKLQESIALRYV